MCNPITNGPGGVHNRKPSSRQLFVEGSLLGGEMNTTVLERVLSTRVDALCGTRTPCTF